MSAAPRNNGTHKEVAELLNNLIVAQEAAGQRSFISSGTLPRKMSPEDRLALETAGVKFGEPVPGDDLFVYAELPTGWKLQGIDNLHSDLLDEQGRKRAGIFYKAAFYDRRTHLHVIRRFFVHIDNTIEGIVTYVAYDGGIDKFTYSKPYGRKKYGWRYKRSHKLAWKECNKWFRQNGFPQWENAGMYWD